MRQGASTSLIVKRRRIPLTASGWTVAVLGVVAYVGGWLLGWVELMVVAAGCLLVLLVAVPFVIGRLALDVERTLEPERVTVGDRVGRRGARHQPPPHADRVAHDRGARRGRPVRLDIPPLGPGRATEAVYPLPTRAPRRGRGRPGPDRQDRPARPDAPGDRPDRHADAVGAPAGRRARRRCRSASPRTSRARRRTPRRPATSPSTPCASTSSATTTATSTGCRRRAPAS